MLPVNFAVGILSQKFENRSILVFSQAIQLCGFALLAIPILAKPAHIHLSLHQYLIGSVFVFLFNQSWEVVCMSIFADIVPKSMSRGTLNAGFLSTEAGTTGRTLGTIIVSVATEYGIGGIQHGGFGVVEVLVFMCAFATMLVFPRLHRQK